MSNPFESARPAGLDSLVSITLLDASGASMAPASIDWRLVDEADEQLLDWAPVPFNVLTPPAAVSITVPASANLLALGQAYGMRTVELRVTTSIGAVTVLTSTYALESANKLVAMVNSYGTHKQLMVAAQYAPETEVMHLTGASEQDSVRALLGAFAAIEQLPLMVVSNKGQELGWLRDMDAATRAVKIESEMRQALMRAQITEASAALGMPGDEIAQARLCGMVSMTVGESSQYFGNARPLELSVSRATTRTLGRYLRRSVRVGRA